MAKVLVASAQVSCGHPPGLLTVPATQTVLKVKGQAVLLVDDVTAVKASSGCLNAPGGVPAPCTTVGELVEPGSSSVVLTVNGKAVALDTATGTTDKAGPISVTKAGQDVLTAK